jgi:hypothetical protein
MDMLTSYMSITTVKNNSNGHADVSRPIVAVFPTTNISSAYDYSEKGFHCYSFIL